MERALVLCLALLVLSGCDNTTTDKGGNQASLTETGPNIQEQESLQCSGELPEQAVLIDGYYELSVCQWPVYMSAELYDNEKASRVFDALRIDLGIVQSRLPMRIVDDLRVVNIWLELNTPAATGGVYHPSELWLEQNGYPIKWAKGVQIGNAENYLYRRQLQPAMVLHELAHAFDDQYYNNANPELLSAYESAKLSGIYESVAYINADQGLVEAYALTNAKEYFAELTEAYFWVNDYLPFNRAQLHSYDMAGFNAVKSMWEQQ